MKIDLNTTLHHALSMMNDFAQDVTMTFIQQGILQPGMTLREALMKMDGASDYHYEMFDKVMESLVNSRNQEPEAKVNTLDDDGPRKFADVLGQSSTLVTEDKPKFDTSDTGITVNQLIDIANPREADELDYILGRLFMNPEKDVAVLKMKLNTLINSDNPYMMAHGAMDISNNQQANSDPKKKASAKFAIDSLAMVDELLLKIKSPQQSKYFGYLDNLNDGSNTRLLELLKTGYQEIFTT